MKITNFYSACLLLLLMFSACGNSDSVGIGQFDNAVIESSANQNKFKQITFTLDVMNNGNEYLNIHRIDSIRLKVNGRSWGVFASESIDTTGNTTHIDQGLKFSSSHISYLVIAPYVLSTDQLQTAGDFVRYLGDRIALAPGDYVCEVSEVKFRNLSGEWTRVKPQAYKNFTVVANTTSSYLGHISITIK
ncbi:MAG: hypothetical protein BGN96_08550 [Bacteroidales bacterium 45-6]|nr:MAG: hypothetical protein BGN96_08550 [Bacteroidales bacterium 45-6]